MALLIIVAFAHCLPTISVQMIFNERNGEGCFGYKYKSRDSFGFRGAERRGSAETSECEEETLPSTWLTVCMRMDENQRRH